MIFKGINWIDVNIIYLKKNIKIVFDKLFILVCICIGMVFFEYCINVFVGIMMVRLIMVSVFDFLNICGLYIWNKWGK